MTVSKRNGKTSSEMAEYFWDNLYTVCMCGSQVLELCANELSDLSELCSAAPPLVHLGLGFNQLKLTHSYLTALYWSTLPLCFCVS